MDEEGLAHRNRMMAAREAWHRRTYPQDYEKGMNVRVNPRGRLGTTDFVWVKDGEDLPADLLSRAHPEDLELLRSRQAKASP